VQMMLPEFEDKGVRPGGEVEIVDPDEFENFRESLGFV
jgi:dynactin 1